MFTAPNSDGAVALRKHVIGARDPTSRKRQPRSSVSGCRQALGLAVNEEFSDFDARQVKFMLTLTRA